MSASALQTFCVYAPDYTDEGIFERRLSVRAVHLVRVGELKASGKIHSGAVLFDRESVSSDAPRKMVGSMIIIKAENIAAARELVEGDVYWTANVWDKERLLIYPAMSA